MNDRDKNDSSNDVGGIHSPLAAKAEKDFHAAVEMTYEEAADAAPGMTHEQAFQIGKNVGIHIGVNYHDTTLFPELMMWAGCGQGWP
jgi:hypothetical protein